MDEKAQELDEKILDIVKQEVRCCFEDPDEIGVTSLAIDIVRGLNMAGYRIVRAS